MGGSGRAKRAMPTLAAQKARVEDGAPGLCGFWRFGHGHPDCAASEDSDMGARIVRLRVREQKQS